MERPGLHAPHSKDAGKSFAENLVRVFSANPTITKAYFGLLYDEQEQQDDLFIAVDHEGTSDEIMNITLLVQQTFIPGKKLFFTSPMLQPDLFGIITAANFPFYVKNRAMNLNMAIMNHWFDPARYRPELLFQVKTGKLLSLFKDFNPLSNKLSFQTYIRNGKEFIPLFSDQEMLAKSGMTAIPADLTLVEFDWIRIDQLIAGRLSGHFYVLNPGTSFETAFHA